MNLSNTPPVGALLATFLVAGLASAQASFTMLPPSVFEANDMTPDGQVIVGSGSGGGYYWRWQVDPAPTFIGGIDARAVSDDGTVIAGNMVDPVSGFNTAGVWTQASGWTPLGDLQGGCPDLSTAYEISGDGSTVVGLAWIGCSSRGFAWTQATGMQELQVLGNGTNRASAISRDGSRVGGFAQGSFNRTPATWDPTNLTGQLYDIDDVGEVYAFNDDGSLVLGEYNGQAFFDLGAGPFLLEPLNQNWIGNAMDLTEDLSVLVGFDIFGLAREAWVWTPSGGMIGLQEKLFGLGVEGVPPLQVCQAISDDGTIIAGHGFSGAWIATLPPEPALSVSTLYGCGTNPAGSLTVVSGAPALGSQITLGVDNPLGTQAVGSLPLVSFSTQPAAGFPCGLQLPNLGMAAPGANGELLIGVVPPNPILTLVGPLWTGAGSPAPIPLFLPPDGTLLGLTLYAQGVLWDYTGTSGIQFGLTEAVELRLGA